MSNTSNIPKRLSDVKNERRKKNSKFLVHNNIANFNQPDTLKQFIDMFFERVRHSDSSSYYILKIGADLEELIERLDELIKRFEGSLKIPLRIDPIILELCKSYKDSNKKLITNLKSYFTNNKEQYQDFYKLTNEFIEFIQHRHRPDPHVYNLYFLKNNDNKHNKHNKHVFNKYLNEATSSELKKKLMSEIRIRRYAIACGFTTLEQLKNMFKFLKYIYKTKLEQFFDFNFDINNEESESENNNNNNNYNNNNNNNNNYNNNNVYGNSYTPATKKLRENIRLLPPLRS